MTSDRLICYRREGDLFVPTGDGVSPWNGRTQNGVAVAGLAAHAIEQVPALAPMHTARLTIDILGTVPMAPLQARSRIVRQGRRMQLVEVELYAEDRAWVRASALRVRIADTPPAEIPLTYPFPEEGSNYAVDTFSRWSESRWVMGAPRTPGPGARWMRVQPLLFADARVSPLVLAAFASDFGTGTSHPLRYEDWTFANLDISIHMTREPRGEWLLLDGFTETAGNGVAMATTRMGDRDGMFATAHQTVFLDPRNSA